MRLQKRLVIYVVLFFTLLLGSFYFMFRGLNAFEHTIF